jgi:hypothetical protein
VTLCSGGVTGQVQFGSHEDSGVVVAVKLVNELTLERAFGRSVPLTDPFPAIRTVFEIDPPSAAELRERDVPGFITLAKRLREIFQNLDDGDLDAAASRLNELLAAHPAPPLSQRSRVLAPPPPPSRRGPRADGDGSLR